jgi:hypothetical protein
VASSFLDRTLSLLASLSRWYNNEKVILLDNLTFLSREKGVQKMKHVKALVVKAIMIWAILWVVLTGLYGVSFMDSTIVGVIIVVMIYVLGDLLILRKVGNIAATIADAGSAAVILWLYLYFMNDTVDIWMKVLIPALLIGVAEWFFHKWLLSQGIVPDERKME